MEIVNKTDVVTVVFLSKDVKTTDVWLPHAKHADVLTNIKFVSTTNVYFSRLMEDVTKFIASGVEYARMVYVKMPKSTIVKIALDLVRYA